MILLGLAEPHYFVFWLPHI